jgi:cob(I)alamin adenosyltransferase
MKPVGRRLLFTGEGKGKTTAALGMALRASGHGIRTLVIQFIKANSSIGDLTGCRHLPFVEIIQTGRGHVPEKTDPKFTEHRRAAKEGLDLAVKAFTASQYDLVILDEICTAIAKGLLEEDCVIEAIQKANPETSVVMTGRHATQGLISLADTVTEMRLIKHGLKDGRTAQKGVEY